MEVYAWGDDPYTAQKLRTDIHVSIVAFYKTGAYLEDVGLDNWIHFRR